MYSIDIMAIRSGVSGYAEDISRYYTVGTKSFGV